MTRDGRRRHPGEFTVRDALFELIAQGAEPGPEHEPDHGLGDDAGSKARGESLDCAVRASMHATNVADSRTRGATGGERCRNIGSESVLTVRIVRGAAIVECGGPSPAPK